MIPRAFWTKTNPTTATQCYPGNAPPGSCPCDNGLVCSDEGVCVQGGPTNITGCVVDPDSCAAMYSCQVVPTGPNVCLPYPRQVNMYCNASPNNCGQNLHCRNGR